MDGSPDPDELQLEEIALPEAVDLEPDEPPPPPRPVKEPLSVILSLVLIAVLVVGLDQWDHRPLTSVFPDKTGQVLIFQNNQSGSTFHDGAMYGAVAIVDLDHRIVVHRFLRGNRPGDQEYFLVPLGRSVAYGWDEIYAAPLDGRLPRQVGSSKSILYPAPERGHVLLFTYPRAREFFTGAPRVAEFSSPRRVVRRMVGMDQSSKVSPGRSVPGGMAYGTEHGIAIWSWSKRRVIRRFGSRPVLFAGGRRDRLVWCDGECRSFHVTKIGGDDRVVRPGKGYAFAFNFPPLTEFSPDGKLLAVPRGRVTWNVSGNPWAATDMVVIDVATGRQRTVYHEPSPSNDRYVAGPAWSRDGHRLFFAIFDQSTDAITVGEYVVASGETHVAPVPIGGAFAPVAVNASDARGFLRAPARKTCTRSDLTVEAPACAVRF